MMDIERRPLFEMSWPDASEKLRHGAKDVLDLIRNLTVVGGLKYLSDESDIIEIQVVVGIAWLALCVQMATLVAPVRMRPFEWLPWARLRTPLNVLAGLAVLFALGALAIASVDRALEVLAAVQSAKK